MKINPRSTYRIQFNKNFRFSDAIDALDYLQELGISHLYASPYFQSIKDSMHGYDVVDPGKIDNQIGGENEHSRLVLELQKRDMSHILDIVPNHMSIAGIDNHWWWDVLENGPISKYAHYFDVDWDPPESFVSNKVLLPVLGDHYCYTIENQELKIKREQEHFFLTYYDHKFPVGPRSLPMILNEAAQRSDNDELAFISNSLERLPLSTCTDLKQIERRDKYLKVIQRYLDNILNRLPELAVLIDQIIEEFNSTGDLIHEFHEAQNYKLAFWKVSRHDSGYRRFFDVNSLVALRMEDDDVFTDCHRLALNLYQTGKVDGFRIDHIDGLLDPEKYLNKIRSRCPDALILAEKILEREEDFHANWNIDGTTGYEFMNEVLGLFIDPKSKNNFENFYHKFTGLEDRFEPLKYKKKNEAIRKLFIGDVHRLTELLASVSQSNRHYRDFTKTDFTRALIEIMTNFPVYRTYIRAETSSIDDVDRKIIENVIAKSQENLTGIDKGVFGFIKKVLLCEVTGETESEFVMRFQQTTGPIMAKGVEDTLFYCYNNFIALNEVGGTPEFFGRTIDSFHQRMLDTHSKFPNSLLATSTHDTKRSEDVRMRLAVLSEIPSKWTSSVSKWSKEITPRRKEALIDRNTEYLIFQTMVGAWPISIDRITEYMTKASRESKIFTSWIKPNEEYEKKQNQFIQNCYNNEYLIEEIKNLVSQIDRPGKINSLAQTLLKVTAPGIPDIYQGCDLWDYSLVDPDNRREVDYKLRSKLVEKISQASQEELNCLDETGLSKLFVIVRALKYRKEFPEIFTQNSDYIPLFAHGKYSENVLSYQRGDQVIVIIPRISSNISKWKQTTIKIPQGNWKNLLSNNNKFYKDSIDLNEIFSEFPVAMLIKDQTC